MVSIYGTQLLLACLLAIVAQENDAANSRILCTVAQVRATIVEKVVVERSCL
jgi:hypothetical protein